MTKGVHLDLHVYLFVRNGEVTERPNVPVLKTGVARATVGSNPTLSALFTSQYNFILFSDESVIDYIFPDLLLLCR